MAGKAVVLPVFKKNYTIRLSQANILAFLLLFPYLRVYGISHILTEKIYSVSIVVNFLTVILFYVMKVRKYDSSFVIWISYSVVLILSCVLNSRNVFYAGYYTGKIIGFYLINKYYLSRHDLTFLRVTRGYMTLIIIATLMQQLLAQDIFGYTASGNFNTFFVSDNYLGYFYTSYMALCVILDSIDCAGVRAITYAEIFICFVSVIRSWSVKAVLGLLIVVLYILFLYRKRPARFFTAKKIVLVYIVIYFGIVVFSVQNYLSAWIYDYLGKGATLSGRTYIWAATMENIKNSPIYGHGLNANGLWAENVTFQGKVFSSHNMFLEVLIQTGIIGLVLYLLFLFTSIRRGEKAIINGSDYEYFFLIFIVFVIYLMGIASPTLYEPFYFMPLILLANYDSLLVLICKRREAQTE